jgi:lactoylglutathione lyase
VAVAAEEMERAMKLEHVAIWTHDLERLRAFYETYFGARAGAKYHNPNHQFESYFLSFATGARLELMQMAGVAASRDDKLAQFTGYIHLAIATGSTEAVDALTARLRADGYPVLDGPRWTGDGYYESVVQDPDGNRVEITV